MMKRTQVIKPTARQLRAFIVEAASAAQEKLEEQRLTKLAKGARLSESTVRRIIKEEVRRTHLVKRLYVVLRESRLLGEGDSFENAFEKIMAGQSFQDLSNDEIEAAIGKLADRFNASDEDIDAALDKLGVASGGHAGEGKLEDQPQQGVGKQRTGMAAPGKPAKQEPDWGKLGFKQAPKRAVG